MTKNTIDCKLIKQQLRIYTVEEYDSGYLRSKGYLKIAK